MVQNLWKLIVAIAFEIESHLIYGMSFNWQPMIVVEKGKCICSYGIYQFVMNGILPNCESVLLPIE